MQNDKEKFKKAFKERLYRFVILLIKFLDAAPKDSISETMKKQLVRSGTSILANYIEGQSAASKKDFTNFFTYSLKSANESKVWLAMLRDTGRTTAKATDPLLDELSQIANIFASSILKLKGKR